MASLRAFVQVVKATRWNMHQTFLREIDALEKSYVEELMALEDPNEGIAACIEKRKPVWKNK